PSAPIHVTSVVFSVFSLLRTRLEISEEHPRSGHRAETELPSMRTFQNGKSPAPLGCSLFRAIATISTHEPIRTETQPLHSAHCNRVSTNHVPRHANTVLVLRGPDSDRTNTRRKDRSGEFM